MVFAWQVWVGQGPDQLGYSRCDSHSTPYVSALIFHGGEEVVRLDHPEGGGLGFRFPFHRVQRSTVLCIA
jgi:hypothetical protein